MDNKTRIITIILMILLISIYIGLKVFSDKPNIEYKDNQIIYKKVKYDDIAQIYLTDFIETTVNNRKDAYDLLDNNYKRTLGTFDDFNNLLNELENENYYNVTLSSYYIKEDNNYRFFFIKDSNGRTYVFKEKGIMDYTVYLDENTVES